MNSEFDLLMKLLQKRCSCRAYLKREVEEEKIRNCIEAARLAPSACNKQPWRFRIVTEKNLLQRICGEGLMPGIPMPWLSDVPVIAVLCADTSIITHTLAPMLTKVKYHLLDTGIAGEHFVLAAEAQGLGTCWIGWFNPKKIRNILNISSSLQILSLISVGYPAGEGKQPEKLSADEIMI
jgi:nitroreductase